MLRLSLLLGAIAALADVAGGLVLVRARGVERYLRYFVALGAGFLMATAVLEMCRKASSSARASARAHHGRLLRRPPAGAHDQRPLPLRRGDAPRRVRLRHTGNSVMAGLSVHALFDGVAIGSGFVVSNWLGVLIFLAILLHKAPEGFTMASVMLASGRSRSMAFYSAVALAAATLWACWSSNSSELAAYGLPVSAGVALYVAAPTSSPKSTASPESAWRWCSLRWAVSAAEMLLPAM